MSQDASSDRRRAMKGRLAGIADGALRLQFTDTKSAGPRLRVRLVSSSEPALSHLRGAWSTKVFVVRAKKSGGSTVTADFDGDEAIGLLRYVARRGVVHRRAAEIAYALLDSMKKGTSTPDEFSTARAEIEKELALASDLVEVTREVKKVVRKRKAETVDGEDAPTSDETPVETKTVTEKVPTDEEISSVVEAIESSPGWIEGFVASAGVVRNATENETDGKRKIGRVIINTHKMPKGAAVASAVRKCVDAGKVGLVRPRVAFTTKKEVVALRKSFGDDIADLVDFESIV